MGDIVCVICGDLTSSDHVYFGYPFWQRALFMEGKGCENCSGVRPPNQDLDGLLHAIHADQDENDKQNRIEKAFDKKDYSDEWVEPPMEVLVTCSACGLKVEVEAEHISSLHDGKTWIKAIGIGRVKDNRATIETVPLCTLSLDDILAEYGEQFYEIDKKIFCSRCTGHCDDCGEAFPETETMFVQDTMETLCHPCEEKRLRCSKCDSYVDTRDDLDDDGECEHCSKWKECDLCDIKILKPLEYCPTHTAEMEA